MLNMVHMVNIPFEVLIKVLVTISVKLSLLLLLMTHFVNTLTEGKWSHSFPVSVKLHNMTVGTMFFDKVNDTWVKISGLI